MKRAGILLKELETVKQIIHDTPLTGSWSDPGSADSLEAWTAIERYKDICQQLILVNLEFALDHQLHHELWMVAFKKPISLLQSKCQDKKSPLRLEAQSDLYWYIDSGSGFYLRLLGFICDAHGTDLPFRRTGRFFGLSSRHVAENVIVTPQSSSLSTFLEQCLVHLGDLSRYRNQMKLAESYYRHAQQTRPSAGQPYSQLALLAAGQGAMLRAAFLYARGSAAKFPFAPAAPNLRSVLQKTLDNAENEDFPTFIAAPQVPHLFLRLLALVVLPNETGSRSITAVSLSRLLGSHLSSIVAGKGLTQDELLQMVCLMIHFVQVGPYGAEGADMNNRVIVAAREILLNLLFDLMSALLLPLYLIKEGSDTKIEAHPGLPSAKLILDWLRYCSPSMLGAPALKDRPQIWPALCHLLNQFQSSTEHETIVKKYSDAPLPEDWKLEGFSHFSAAHKNLSFSRSGRSPTQQESDALRVHRLGQILRWLAAEKGIYVSVKNEQGTNSVTFEPRIQPTEKVNRTYMKMFPSLTSLLDTAKDVAIKPGILKMAGNNQTAEKSVILSTPPARGENSTGPHIPATTTPIAPLERKSKAKTARKNVAMASILKSSSTGVPLEEVHSPPLASILKTAPDTSPPSVAITEHPPDFIQRSLVIGSSKSSTGGGGEIPTATMGKSVTFRTPPPSVDTPPLEEGVWGGNGQVSFSATAHRNNGHGDNYFSAPGFPHSSNGFPSSASFLMQSGDSDATSSTAASSGGTKALSRLLENPPPGFLTATTTSPSSLWDQPIASRSSRSSQGVAMGGNGLTPSYPMSSASPFKQHHSDSSGSMPSWPPPLFSLPPPLLGSGTPSLLGSLPSSAPQSYPPTAPSTDEFHPHSGAASSYSLFGPTASRLWPPPSGPGGSSAPASSTSLRNPLIRTAGPTLGGGNNASPLIPSPWLISSLPGRSSSGRLFDIRPPAQPP